MCREWTQNLGRNKKAEDFRTSIRVCLAQAVDFSLFHEGFRIMNFL